MLLLTNICGVLLLTDISGMLPTADAAMHSPCLPAQQDKLFAYALPTAHHHSHLLMALGSFQMIAYLSNARCLSVKSARIFFKI